MDRSRRLWLFRARLLAAFGVGMIPGLLVSADAGAEVETTECYALMEGESCLPANMQAAVLERLELGGTDDGCTQYAVQAAVDTGDAPTECCYQLLGDRSECYDDVSLDCGCYGRPYVDPARGHHAVTAPVVHAPSWAAGDAGPRPDLTDLSPAQRAALAQFWADNGQAEHSSVAGFHRLCLELIAHGAPLELLARSQQAAADELVHARICFALASAYAGSGGGAGGDLPLGPGPMPLGTAAPIAGSLVELAVATAREGCLGETGAAWLACELAAEARDPVVRAALDRIAADEAAHAELAWMTLRWAIEAGGPEVRAAVAEVFAAAQPSHSRGPNLDVRAHGLVAAREVQAITERGFVELLVPLMRAALAA